MPSKQRRKSPDDFHQLLNQEIDFAAEIAGDRTERDADKTRNENHRKGDQQRHAGAMNHAAEDVASEIVGAEHVQRADARRRLHHRRELLLIRIVRRYGRADDAH